MHSVLRIVSMILEKKKRTWIYANNKLITGETTRTIRTNGILTTQNLSWRMRNTKTCCHSNFSERPSVNADVDTHKLQEDFVIPTYHLISARRPDLIIIKKKPQRICIIVDFAVPAEHIIKLKKCENKTVNEGYVVIDTKPSIK